MKYYKSLLAGVCLMAAFASCKKAVNINETDLIAGPLALKTVTNCEQGIIGGYAALGTEMDILLNATLSDEMKKGEFYNAGTTHEWQYSSTDVSIRDNFTAITPNYQIIDRVNRVLQALPTADSTKVGDNSLRAKLRGEALFLRAYAHFEAFRYYGGPYNPTGLAMPYMETPSLGYQLRIEMLPFFTKLNADLTEAKNLVPNNLTDINRATRMAVTGLQARVALYMNNWVAAETFASEYITAIPLSPIAQFGGIWTDANTNELAMRIVRGTGIRIGSLFRGTSANAANIGTITWLPSDKLWDSYDQVNDVRFAAYFKTEPLLVAPRPNRLINKYAGATYGATLENVANGKVFRTGEMYLIRAEARAEQDKFTGANSAESDLNTLRAARINGYVPVVLASKPQAITEIMNERFKELAYEGHRFWDLKRKGLAVVRNASDAPNTNSVTLPAGDFRFLLPIPNSEVQANPIIQQNPGYF